MVSGIQEILQPLPDCTDGAALPQKVQHCGLFGLPVALACA
jgi:hypothetical protein